MNITPTLPNPQPVATQSERKAVAQVHAIARTRDAVDEPEQRPAPQRIIDEARRAQLVARAEAVAVRQGANTPHANRALASYNQVANDDERGSLRDLLGFDDYA